MPVGLSKGFKIPAPPKYDGRADVSAIANWLRVNLYIWLERLVVALENQFALLQQQVGTTVSITGKMILPVSTTIIGNSAQDDIYRVNSSVNFTITRAACWYRGATVTGSPTIRISNTASASSGGILISLTSGDRGSATGSVAITAGNPIYVRYTNCDGLGIGEIYLDFA